jgi:hypothetical protein
MAALELVPREEALRRVPESPTTIEARAIVLDPRPATYRSGDGLLLVDQDGRLVCALGAVVARDVDAAFESLQLDCELVADPVAHERLKATRTFERAILQRLSSPWQPRPHVIAGLTIRQLAAADSLAHLPEELREEIEFAREHFDVLCGEADGLPVSFSYTECTEKLADLSIDTLEAYCNRGIGTAVAAAAIDDVVARGFEPVWGALVSNAQSLRLAAKLGFDRYAGELFVSE